MKTQIEGFTSLSSDLTALSGTVASLQTAINSIDIPAATDISGLEESLVDLAADLADLQKALADADTSAEVDALTENLAEVKLQLQELLDSNNIYAPSGTASELVVNTQSTLDFATALGDKIIIINGSITIEQTASMDATQLEELMAKIKSVTGDVSYTATATGVVPTAGFTALTGVATLTMDVAGDISLPVLASASKVVLKDNTKVTSVSLPVLASVTTLAGAADHKLSFAKATSFDMAALTSYGSPLEITVKSGEVDLSALTNAQANTSTLSAHKLTLIGAETLVAPLRVKGAIVADDLTAVDLPLWQWAATSSFKAAKTITLPSVTGAASIAIETVAPEAETVSITATKEAVTTTQTDYATVTVVGNTNLESLTLSGDFQTVQIDDASSLTELALSGVAHTVHVIDTDIVDLVLAYEATLADNDESGALLIKDNDALESVVADSVDDIRTFTLQGNPDLASISFASLNSVGTTSATKPATVLIGGVTAALQNDLEIENIQTPSEEGDLPVVTKKIVSADMAGLSDYLAAAKEEVGTTGKVIAMADDVLAVTSVEGIADESPTVTDELKTIIHWDPTVKSTEVGGTAAVQEFQIPSTSVGPWTFSVGPNAEFISSITDSGSALAFDLSTWADNSANKANFAAIGVEVTTGSPYKGKITLENAVTASAAVYAVTVEGETFTATLSGTYNENDVMTALRAKILDGAAISTLSTYNVGTPTAGVMTFTTQSRGSASTASKLDLSTVSAYLNVTLATITGTLGSATTVTGSKLVEKDLTSGWIKVRSLTAGLDAATATVASITGGTVASATQLLSTGLGTATKTTGDNENVVYATAGTPSTVSAATIAAARVDNTEFLAAS